MYKNYKPIIDSLAQYASKDLIRMHMPGHKGKLLSEQMPDNIIKYDITEIPGMDNLHEPEGIIYDSMKACAMAFGAKHTFFLVNGSTSGIHTMLATLNKGDKILVSRNCHISVIHGLIIFGLKPVYVVPQFDYEWQLVVPADISTWKKAVERNPDAKGALVTSPDYYGICSNLSELAKLLHKNGKLLFVDEAHGAHFAFSPRLPATALEQGADMCVQSLHKTMPALTQSALLHIGTESICADTVKRALSVLTTTSPSYLIMASIDYARELMVREGARRYQGLINTLSEMKQDLSVMEKLRLVPDSIMNFDRDPTRLVVDTSRSAISGNQLYRLLYDEYGIIAEMADESHVVFIITPADSGKDIAVLKKALLDIDKKIKTNKKRPVAYVPFNQQQCILPDISVFVKNSAFVPLEKAEGLTSASVVSPYPPGIPVLFPGETITSEVINYLHRLVLSGFEVHGIRINDKNCPMIRVLSF
jgi:lysine decarboxylase